MCPERKDRQTASEGNQWRAGLRWVSEEMQPDPWRHPRKGKKTQGEAKGSLLLQAPRGCLSSQRPSFHRTSGTTEHRTAVELDLNPEAPPRPGLLCMTLHAHFREGSGNSEDEADVGGHPSSTARSPGLITIGLCHKSSPFLKVL